MKKLFILSLFSLLCWGICLSAFAQWTVVPSGTNLRLRSVHFPSGMVGYAVGDVTNGKPTILKSIDGGNTWMMQNSAGSVEMLSVFFTDENTGVAVGQQKQLLRTTNGGTTWQEIPSGAINRLWSVHFPTSSIGYAVGTSDIIRTQNGGVSWQPLNANVVGGLKSVFFPSATRGFAVGSGGRIIRTTDGVNWVQLNSNTPVELNGVHFVGLNVGYVVGNNGLILKTINGGETWQSLNSNVITNLHAVRFASENIGFAIGAGGLILHTTNGGISWNVQSSNTIFELNGIDVRNANTAHIVGGNGTILRYTDNCNFNLSVSPSQPGVCPGGSVDIIASGGQSYNWAPTTGILTSANQAGITVAPTQTTTYTVTATNGACVQTRTVTVTVGTINLEVSSSVTGICPGGQATLVASGATIYNWQPAVNIQPLTGPVVTASPSISTTYTVTGISGNCVATKTVTVNVSGFEGVTVSPLNANICNNSTVNLTATGGTSYSWVPATGLNATQGANVIASPPTTTTYTVTAQGIHCPFAPTTAQVTVTVGNAGLTINPPNPQICNIDGATSLLASGAQQYTWSPPFGLSATVGDLVIANPTVTTTYTVTGFSGNCVDTKTVTVTVSQIPVDVFPPNPSICPNGTITLTASGADIYAWEPTTGLSAGTGGVVTASPAVTTTYTLTGTKGACTSTKIFTVNVGTINVSISPTNSVICKGETQTLTAQGGLSYFWAPAESLNIANGESVVASPLTTTTYTVTAFGGSCSATATATVTVAPEFSVQPTTTGATVNQSNGTLTVIVLGGTPPLSYKLNNGPFQASNLFTGLAAGNYTVTVQDAFGCTRTTTATVFQQQTCPNPVITANGPTSFCQGNSVLLSAEFDPLVTYQWRRDGIIIPNTGSNTYLANQGGNYSVLLTKPGCPSVFSNNIGVTTTALTLSASSTLASNGFNGTISVVATGGMPLYLYRLNDGVFQFSGSFTNLTPGNYTITARDANGCIGQTSIDVAQPIECPTAVIANGNQFSTCVGSILTLQAPFDAGSEYQWRRNNEAIPGANSFIYNATSTGFYTVTMQKPGCVLSTSPQVQVTVNPLPNITTTTVPANIGNNNGSITVNATGGLPSYLFAIENLAFQSSNTFNGLPTGNYTVRVKDANGCEQTAIVNVAVLNSPCPQPTVTTGTVNACNGGGVTLFGPFDPAGVYQWYLNGNAITGANQSSYIATLTGNYSVAVAKSGCTTLQSSPLFIAITPLIQVNLSSVNPNNGANGTISASATGGVGPYTYSINNVTYQNSNTFAGLAAGTYTVRVRDVNGCIGEKSITLTQTGIETPCPIASVSPNTTQSLCGGDNVVLSAPTGANFVYQWRKNGNNIAGANQSTFIANETGFYSVLIIRAGCPSSVSPEVTVQVLAPVIVTVSSTPANSGLNNGTITASAVGGIQPYSYSLDGVNFQGSNIFTGLAPGTYTVIAKDTKGCTRSNSIVVSNQIGSGTTNCPAPTITATNTSVCANGEGLATLSTQTGEGFFYQWMRGGVNISGSTGATISVNLPGNYTVRVSKSGCTSAISPAVTITQANSPTLNLTATSSTEIAPNGTITANASSGTFPYRYSLNNGPLQTANTFVGLAPGNYEVRVVDANNCYATKNVTVGAACGPKPPNFNLIQSGNGSAIVSWTPVANAIGYKFIYRRIAPTFSSNVEFNLFSNVTGLSLTNLTPGATYEVQIFTRCQSGLFSDALTFTFVANSAARLAEDTESPALKESVSLYPNPNKGTFTLKFVNVEAQTAEVSILNLAGKRIFNEELVLHTGETEVMMALQDLPQGVYLVKIVRSNANVQTIKLVVE